VEKDMYENPDGKTDTHYLTNVVVDDEEHTVEVVGKAVKQMVVPKILARCEEPSCQFNLEMKDEVSAQRVLKNHMFVAHKRQEQDHQQKLCGRKGGRRGGAKHKIVPIKNPPSGGVGPKYDLINRCKRQMSERLRRIARMVRRQAMRSVPVW
jgi:hypothetical protein